MIAVDRIRARKREPNPPATKPVVEQNPTTQAPPAKPESTLHGVVPRKIAEAREKTLPDRRAVSRHDEARYFFFPAIT
jgi:hypothetical protein